MIDDNKYAPSSVYKNEWANAKCDKYDFLIAAFCGGLAGVVDVFFVGDPLTSKLGKSVDNVADGFVKKAAQFFWNNDKRTQGKRKTMPQTLEQCISYLEQAFPVNYDARYAKDLNLEEGALSGMRSLNHHLMSLSHSPDPIGLIFSIINQFMGYATFVDHGKIIHVVPKKTNGSIPYMQGNDFLSMLFCGFVNWLGHIISDMVGSSSTRKPGKTGRGTGIPIPFYELFLGCEFGDFDGKTLAEVMIKVFEEGYDFRFGITMAIPVILEELMIKTIWMIRQKFMRKKSWRESIPTKDHADLRIMLIVGNGTLCAIDGIDAAAHGLVKGGDVISFICHLNLIGWCRLVMLVLRELSIRLGPIINEVIDKFLQSILSIITPSEQEKIYAFRARLYEFDRYLSDLFNEFVKQVEKEYLELYSEINSTFDKINTSKLKSEHSIKLAEICSVDEKNIIQSNEQLDDLFL